MPIRKCLITAAGPSQRSIPLQHLIDSDGQDKPALAIVILEAIEAGVSEVGLVVHPNDADPYLEAAGPQAQHITVIEQREPYDYGHALLAGADFIGDEPFLHMVSDHLYVHRGSRRCAEQLVHAATSHGCSVSGVQSTREHLLHQFGAVGGRPLPGSPRHYVVERILEKPTPTVAEQQLIVPGLRAGHYLCFFGMHVLSPRVMTILTDQAAASRKDGRRLELSCALNSLAHTEQYLALEMSGRRYHLGVRYGVLAAQLALGLSGIDRDEVLTLLVNTLAASHDGGDSEGCREASRP